MGYSISLCRVCVETKPRFRGAYLAQPETYSFSSDASAASPHPESAGSSPLQGLVGMGDYNTMSFFMKSALVLNRAGNRFSIFARIKVIFLRAAQ